MGRILKDEKDPITVAADHSVVIVIATNIMKIELRDSGKNPERGNCPEPRDNSDGEHQTS